MERPKIKLELSVSDKVIEALGYLAVAAIWILLLANYNKLPASVPIHYNGAGNVNMLGDKSSIVVLPLLATVLFSALTILNKSPNVFNYPVAITKEKAAQQYTNATRLIRYLKGGIVVIFGIITFRTIQTACKQADGLGTWFLPVILGIIFIPLLVFLVKSFKTK
ncbi:DUF1648 domain-containing protein [Hymenobacter sp. BRD67]|uniref:DUF1648 domain-containing protein n=1 Tax=Hymenobacter sp. BRD67 TaxID=2675877 RepID=UPI0015644317|nr:DUF1648 domain-containing protein [Hymenobacter sp. BRD67]QKG52181.1 DUF1648 domain-containing protein [Hymenobacter sp. BRD67]